MRRMSGFPPPPTVGALSTGMTKNHSLKNVIPRLDRGIQVSFNLKTKYTKLNPFYFFNDSGC